jgi:two-component system nitrogen regulation response regulator NtrX
VPILLILDYYNLLLILLAINNEGPLSLLELEIPFYMPGHILIVDDERSIRSTLSEILSFEGYQISEAADGQEALRLITNEGPYDCIVCDIKMPKADGIEVLEKTKEIMPDTPFIVISGHGNIDTAVEAVKKGAYDYISKPPDLNRLLITIRNAMDKKSLVTETKTLKKKISKGYEIIGDAPALLSILEMVDKVAPTDARVLITGSNGSGKELVARRIHDFSNRNRSPMVEVNCAAIPSELIESELFGHEKGSFTSAIKQRIGKFEQADGGTLFLDEIGDMSLSAQAKVLRALQEGKITRVGGDKEISVNVRVLAATNKNLKQEIAEGRFREDLYHRLSVILLHVPSLNERVDDIKPLSEHFLAQICNEYGIAEKSLDDSAIKKLQTHDWTGNIRELRNVIERLIILSDKVITKKEVEQYILLK